MAEQCESSSTGTIDDAQNLSRQIDDTWYTCMYKDIGDGCGADAGAAAVVPVAMGAGTRRACRGLVLVHGTEIGQEALDKSPPPPGSLL